MSYFDRKKPLIIKIGGETFDVLYKDWEIAHTLNNKVFTFSQFIEAYVSKQEANGFSLTFDGVFSGENYDLEAERFRVALQSKETCRIVLPIGQRTELLLHCVGFSEKWDLVNGLGAVTFSLNFHTTTEFSLPKSAIAFIEEIFERKLALQDDLSEAIFSFSKAIKNVKSTIGLVNNILGFTYQSETELTSKANSIASFVEGLEEAKESNINIILNSFHAIIDLPNKYSENKKKNAKFFKKIEVELNKKGAFEGDPNGYMFCNASLIRARAGSVSKYSNATDFTRLEVLKERKEINLQYEQFLIVIHSLSANSIASSNVGTFVPSVNSLNSLENLVAISVNNFERLAFNGKIENTIITNEYLDFYVFVNRYYKLNSLEEIEKKVDEIIAINNFKGNNIYGIVPQQPIKYLT